MENICKIYFGVVITFVFLLLPFSLTGQSFYTSGELKKWHRITITFDGPSVSETSTSNTFLNYRLDVTFTHSSGKTYKVPGYFAADGNAGETGASSGTKWRVHFAPDETGTWTYLASFRQGTNLAISDDANAGTAAAPLNGSTGSVTINSSDKSGKDLRAKGRLKYVGQHYLQFSETGEYFVKAGADSPENFLAYTDFDNTPNNGSRRKSWSPHVQDWLTGDPTWKGGKGKGIIGAVNYLSSMGMNSFSFLTMNIKGDDQNVYPYINSTDFTRMDVSKLDQWEIVLEHAQKMGMYLHFKLQETENNTLLDGGSLGTQRKLYLRELIARFSHHLALNWNVGEENTQTDAQRKAMAKYIYDHDPYKHHIVIHTYPGQHESVYRPLLGSASSFSGVSIQTGTSNVYPETRKWVEASAGAGKKWVVANDEQNSATAGVAADAEYTGSRGTVADNSETIRKDVLWGNLMAGGGGVEYYFGYNTGETDLTAQDFRSRAKSWRYAKYALDFFRTYLPVNEMKPLSNVSSGWSLGKAGAAYVVYLKSGGTSNITLPTGNYTVKWYNPRTGGALQNGSKTTLTAGTVSIGTAPSATTSDWAVLILNGSIPAPSNNSPTVGITSPASNISYVKPASMAINANASDTDGTITKVEFFNGSTKLGEDITSPYSYSWTQSVAGTYTITAVATDNAAASTTSSAVNINVTDPVTSGGVVFAVNAGGSAFTASNGIAYQADKNFTGGTAYSTAGSILNTTDDPLYQTERFGNFSYSIPVTSGNYEITFRFAEIFHQTAGKRQFDVLMEGINVIDNLDLFATAGYQAAYDVVKTVTVSDGILNIVFTNVIDQAKLSALSVKTVTAVTAPVVFAVNAGGSAFTSSKGIAYQADKNFTGGSVYSTTGSILNTTDDPLYQTERFGNFSYAIPVSNGDYELTFCFAEVYHQSTGQRQFDVLVEGNNVIDNLDLFAAAGYLTAYDVIKTVTVIDGIINIAFNNVIDRAKLSAFSVKAVTSGSALASLQPLNIMSTQPVLKTTEEIPSIENLSVYPNPSSGIVNVLSGNPSVIAVFNSQGKNVYSDKLANTRHQINLSAFGPGMYIIQLQTNGKKTVRKVIVAN